ncbi:MAG: FKBP-type peptidyl-prolyl cis-trans isomerase [Saprospiraceae bacterium]
MKNLFFLLGGLLLLGACANDVNLVTENGYRYEMHTDVAGETVKPTQAAEFFFQMMKGDSVVLNSRDQNPEPQVFLLPEPSDKPVGNTNIIVDALKLMSVGDSMSIFLALDTIEQRPPGFGPEDELRYDITLVNVMDGATYQAAETARNAEMKQRLDKYTARGEAVADSTATILAAYKKNPTKAGFTKTSTGLMYKILEAGKGPQANVGDPVLVSYYGVLTNGGTMFDNSFRNGRPIDFPLGQGAVIPGWDEGIGLLKQGSRAVLAIPSELAYGPTARGPIPANAELLFYVQLEGVQVK